MARLPRLIVPNQPHHVIQCGQAKQPIFLDADDYAAFLVWLRDASKLFKVAIHAYVLMPSHLHLLLSPSDQTGLAKMMQWIGRCYVPYFNRKYQRDGTLWKGRYKATVLDAVGYFLTCSRYVELNPVRAGLVENPADYPWSSYAHHIGAKRDVAITDHAVYWGLGNTPFQREAAYKELAEQALKESEIALLREATSKGWALGSEQFKVELEKKCSRRVSPKKRGRPVKSVAATTLHTNSPEEI
jgi:putative transposase